MDFQSDQIEELKKFYSDLKVAEEGGYTYIYIPNLDLPDGCTPTKVNALFCPMLRDGYQSRLFFAEKISCSHNRNWNGQARILDQTWYAISWNINNNQRLIQLIRSHLDAFRK